MSFTVSPTSVAPSAQITATGTGAKKRKTRIRVAQADPVMGNAILAEFVMPASGKFSRLITAPGGVARSTSLVLQQLRTDDVWAQTADVSIKLLPATGGGTGGTTPEPPNTPPPPTPDTTPPTIPSFTQTVTGQTTVTFNATTNEASTVIFEYGTTTALGTSTSATASGTSHSKNVTGLTAGTTYYVQARATDTAGNGPTLSSVRQFTTNAATPIPPPPGDWYVVNSISALKTALANNSITQIEVANGTYSVSPASGRGANALWIGAAYAGRTNPVHVRAQTTGGVTFDGADQKYMGFMVFADGAHHQTWEGFKFANGEPTAFGVIVFGSNVAQNGSPPHHITLLDVEFLSSLTSVSPDFHDHGIYVADAISPGVHDILVDGFTVTAPPGGIQSAVHFFHSDGGRVNARDFTVRNMAVTGTEQAVVVWDETVVNIVFEDCVITNAERFAVRYELGGTLVLNNVDSTGSGTQGFYSSLGPTPPGVTFGPGTSLS